MKKANVLKLALSAILLLTILPESQAQTNARNRIKVAYSDAFFLTTGYILIGGVMGGSLFEDVDDVNSTGTFSVGYRRLLNNDRWTLGGDFSYAGITEKYEDGTKNTLSLYSVMAATEYYYKKSGIFRLYGTVGVGGSFSPGSTGLAFQVNPIAMRIGTDRIAGFLEVGAGTKGLCNFGLEIGF